MALAEGIEQGRLALRMINPAPFNAEAPPEALAGPITPNELHYVRSNFAVPVHDGTLEIGGAVGNPLTLTLDDLRALPATERAVTLECAGNGRLEMRPLPIGEPWGDFAVSTARWTGALLHQVLQLARPAADGVDVRFEGADHGAYHLKPVLAETDKDDLTFVRALPLAHASDPAAEILIAYEMNGAPLGSDHGAPFRVVVPHWYAVASVKWLKRIDVLTEPYTGEFQTGHYLYEWPDRPAEAVSLMRVRARITHPAPASTVNVGKHTVRGKAWSGTGPVTRVEVSLTGEGEWYLANLEPPEGPYQWQDWSFEWNATDVGRHTLRARATDAAGNVQPEVPPWNRLGYGNNAVEVPYVDVR
ncbi:molybdenum-dependent oxidoreductase-like protein [Kribbella orskensis]|uniref:Molybdenum-dependent oxidoreductase-like protein n=1 Tax=Kribbella orskensis TaxID=2512216 RepID=A0ABY2B9Y0_9ACTN|nr:MULTISPECIES: sulfite oxidase [Kribbella]TCN31671.1 molybdenum-dependent oxidoreductase-like protein [Kribbella sp. VKM Ac-2500]TCO12323.1 molybdenum-dependent oxidoreductase-like protein [Kribbella orskensis]